MSKIFTVAVVGAGIGRSHITEGYLNNPDKFRVIAICDLDAAKMTTLADFKTAPVLMVVFLSNHCPYSHAAETRLLPLALRTVDVPAAIRHPDRAGLSQTGRRGPAAGARDKSRVPWRHRTLRCGCRRQRGVGRRALRHRLTVLPSRQL